MDFDITTLVSTSYILGPVLNLSGLQPCHLRQECGLQLCCGTECGKCQHHTCHSTNSHFVRSPSHTSRSSRSNRNVTSQKLEAKEAQAVSANKARLSVAKVGHQSLRTLGTVGQNTKAAGMAHTSSCCVSLFQT